MVGGHLRSILMGFRDDSCLLQHFGDLKTFASKQAEVTGRVQ